jgi:hypothetical protein
MAKEKIAGKFPKRLCKLQTSYKPINSACNLLFLLG